MAWIVGGIDRRRHVAPRRQFSDAGDGMAVGDAGEHVLEIGEGLDAAHFAGFDDAGDHRPVLGTAVTAGEEGVLHSQFLRTDGPLDGALIHFEPTVGEEAAEISPAGETVADGTGQVAAAGNAVELLFQPDVESVHQGARVFLADIEPDVGGTTAYPRFDRVELGIASQGFLGDGRAGPLVRLIESTTGVDVAARDLNAAGGLAQTFFQALVIGAIAVAMDGTAKPGQVPGGILVSPVVLIDVGHRRRPVAPPGPFISRIGPEETRLCPAQTGFEHRHGRLVGEDHRRTENVAQDVIVDRPEEEADLADPAAQGLAVELDAVPFETLGLPVERQVVGVLVDENAGQQALGRHAAGNRALRRRGLDNRAFAGPAPIFRPVDGDDLQRRRHPIELLGDVLADDMQGAIAARTDLLFRLDEAVLAGQVFGQGAAIVVARCLGLRVRLGILRRRLCLVLGFDGRQRLRQVIEGELQLIGGETFGAATKLMTLQLGDDGQQLVAFEMGTNELALVIVPLT